MRDSAIATRPHLTRDQASGVLWWLAIGKSQFVKSAMKCNCISTGARHSTSEVDDFMNLMKLLWSKDPCCPVSEQGHGQRHSLASKSKFKIIQITALIKKHEGDLEQFIKIPLFQSTSGTISQSMVLIKSPFVQVFFSSYSIGCQCLSSIYQPPTNFS